MRFATWNVNSLKARLPRIEEFLGYADVDVLCLQETKCSDKTFPALTFSGLGYESVHYGQGQWNGVAVLSRKGIDSADHGFGDGYDDPYVGDARLLVVRTAGIDFVSVYVPNGRAVGTDTFTAKLAFLDAMGPHVAAIDVLGGDMNVCPADDDVYDPAAFAGETHVTPDERERLAAVVAAGMVDAYRAFAPGVQQFTWWDYRQGHFHRGFGLRIDLLLVKAALAPGIENVGIDRNFRKGPKPSDHAPLLMDLTLPGA